MKKTIIIASIFFSLIGVSANFIYDMFTQLNSQISNLKTTNKNLKTKNTILTKKQKDIKNKISNLKTTNNNLKTKNSALIIKQEDIKKKISQRKKELFKQKLSRAKKKLAKATTSAIPFVGTASVVGMTYWEMENYCNDIKEFKKFEESVFGKNDETISEEEKALCGYDYTTIEKIVLKDLNEFEVDTKDWASKTYNEWSNNFNIELNKIKTEYMGIK